MFHGDEPLLEAIEAIYGASTDPALWQVALCAISSLFDATAATLLQDTVTGAGAVFASIGIGRRALDLYNDRFVGVDPAVRVGSQLPVGTWVSTDNLFSGPKFDRKEMTADLLLPKDLYRIAGSVLVRTENEYASLGLHRPKHHRPFDDRDEKRYLVIQPHLQRSLAVTRRLGRTNADQQALRESIDRLRTGIVVLDGRGRVILANRLANDIAKEQDGFGLTPEGPVGARSGDSRMLRAHIADALQKRTRDRLNPRPTAIQLGRPSGKRPLEIIVVPLAESDRVGDGCRGRIALYITDPERGASPPESWLKELYGMTCAEAAVAVSIANGASIDETANRLGVSRNTVRSHLQRAMQKTDTRRQGQLIRVILGGSAGSVNSGSIESVGRASSI